MAEHGTRPLMSAVGKSVSAASQVTLADGAGYTLVHCGWPVEHTPSWLLGNKLLERRHDRFGRHMISRQLRTECVLAVVAPLAEEV